MIAAVLSFRPLLSQFLLPSLFVSYLLFFYHDKNKPPFVPNFGVFVSLVSTSQHHCILMISFLSLHLFLFFFCKQGGCVCEQVLVNSQPPHPKWHLILSLLHQCMSSFKSSSSDLPPSDSPHIPLLWSSSPSCLLLSILYPFLPLPDVGREICLSFDLFFNPPPPSNLVARPWQVSEENRTMWKMENGGFTHAVLPFLLLRIAWRASLSLISEGKEENKMPRRSERWYRTAGNREGVRVTK